MKAIRLALTIVSLALLVAGYAASQWAYFAGDPAAHAARMDQPPIRIAALIILLAAIALSFVPDRDSERGDA